MNTLEHYIKEIKSVEPCQEDWTKEFEGNFLNVKVVTDCYGCIEDRETVIREDEWETVKGRGYFMW